MSNNFWVELSVALLLLASGITLVHQYKFGAIRRLRAKWLRQAMLATLQQLLGELSSATILNAATDDYRLFRLRADLEQQYQRAHVLFEEERALLANFLAAYSSLNGRIQSGLATISDLDTVVLKGQRAVLEISEIAA